MHPTTQKANELAGLYSEAGDYDKALPILEQAAKAEPNNATILNNLALCLNAKGKVSPALTAARRAVAIQPNTATLNTLALILERDWQLPEAIATFTRAAEYADDYGSYVNLGNALQTARDFKASTKAYERALAFAPFNPGTLCNLGYNAFLQGDYERGWSYYEARLRHYPPMVKQCQEYGAHKLLARNPARNERVLIWAEQGIGDTLQFIRYVPLMAKAYPNSHFILNVPPELLPLLKGQPYLYRCEVKAEPADNLEYKTHLPLMSVPYFLGRATYDPGTYLVWAKRKKLKSKLLNVGYCWQGNPQHANDHNRSIEPSYFDRLRLPGVKLWSLQYGQDDFGLSSWQDTAAAINALDVVVTADTSVLHLAAAMGKETWGLINYRPDPRWGLGSAQPWYSSLILFRQERPKDWASVFDRVASALATLTSAVG